MAKAFLEMHLQRQGDFTEVQVLSAGMSAGEELPASREAVEVMKTYGIDLSKHRSRLLQEDQVREANLVLTMTTYDCQTLRKRFSRRAHVIFPLKAFVNGTDEDVLDPFGGGPGMYRSCAAELNLFTKSLVDLL